MKICNKCNKDKSLSSFYKNQGVCKKCLLARMKELRIADPNKSRDQVTKSRLKLNFGLSVEDYNEILAEQDYVCAICKSPQHAKRMFQLCVDHCHETGKVRGLLCNDCNVGLGRFKDNKTSLTNALEYLA